MIGLDTNILVRYLTQDDPGQSPRATELIERRLTEDNPGFISVVAMTETVWVLERAYRFSNVRIAEVIERLLQTSVLVVENEAEVFAAYTAYTDNEIGRVIQEVQDEGKLDNTLIIYICGDNGTSAEGTLEGTPNQMTAYNGILDLPEVELMRYYESWGSDATYPHMAVQWSWAFDTPFKWTKQVASHFGGTRQGMVVSWHDAGMTGDSLGYALTVMVPRFIWPNKPEITAIGADLYTAATAQTGSSISPGLFAEAYWNFGWLGVPFLMIPLGIILGLFSQYSLYIGETENWLHLPVVFLGVQIGTRVDGTYVADVIGASGIALVCALMLFIIEITLSRRQPH